VVAAIDFHDEPNGRRQKIRDELVPNADLPPKRDAELAPTNEVPERRFRRCELKQRTTRSGRGLMRSFLHTSNRLSVALPIRVIPTLSAVESWNSAPDLAQGS
jgi:hypothetical protein